MPIIRTEAWSLMCPVLHCINKANNQLCQSLVFIPHVHPTYCLCLIHESRGQHWKMRSSKVVGHSLWEHYAMEGSNTWPCGSDTIVSSCDIVVIWWSIWFSALTTSPNTWSRQQYPYNYIDLIIILTLYYIEQHYSMHGTHMYMYVINNIKTIHNLLIHNTHSSSNKEKTTVIIII